MGLAPWANHVWPDAENDIGDDVLIQPTLHTTPILEGKLQDGSLKIDRTLMQGMPFIARSDPDMFAEDGTLLATASQSVIVRYWSPDDE